METSSSLTAAGGLAAVRVWVDGALVGPEGAVRALDHGLTVGDGVFETCKVVDDATFALTRHHDRMDRSLAALGLAPLNRERIGEGIQAVLAEGGMPFGRLRYTVTAGLGPLGSDRVEGAATYVVTAVPQEPMGPTTSVLVVPWTRNERGALTGVKSTSYAENVVALGAAKAAGHSEAILANSSGLLCEGTGTNVFVVTDGVVRTPDLASGPLAGVTRGLAIEWLRQEGLEVLEEPLPLSVLDEADEVWITSSIRDLTAVTRLDVADGVELTSGRSLERPQVSPRVVSEGAGEVTARAQEIFARRAAERRDP
ncbi:aminotransferase class IV [Serinicoccus kebangsaanensis]|uniref:aminotransferase class IV n=1 Tax=Serinicoccus kebangsaanensis TaxID=2602069 RepID=UPI001EE17416|nr:aminotransferase class IV [Serinicoccus kebangsaanensis]